MRRAALCPVSPFARPHFGEQVEDFQGTMRPQAVRHHCTEPLSSVSPLFIFTIALPLPIWESERVDMGKPVLVAWIWGKKGGKSCFPMGAEAAPGRGCALGSDVRGGS